MAPGALVKESVSHTFLISGIWTNETNRPDRWKDHPSGGGEVCVSWFASVRGKLKEADVNFLA